MRDLYNTVDGTTVKPEPADESRPTKEETESIQ